jgi:hypothetical protein
VGQGEDCGADVRACPFVGAGLQSGALRGSCCRAGFRWAFLILLLLSSACGGDRREVIVFSGGENGTLVRHIWQIDAAGRLFSATLRFNADGVRAESLQRLSPAEGKSRHMGSWNPVTAADILFINDTVAASAYVAGGVSPRSANQWRRNTRSAASFARCVTDFIRQSNRGDANGMGTPSTSWVTTSVAARA